MRLPRFSLLFVVTPLLSLGCYNPNIAQGGFTCAAGNVCPENFRCASDGKCYSGAAGPDASATCQSPPPKMLCGNPVPSGQSCSPTCQSGCACGWCSISGGGASCTTVAQGKSQLGDVCDPNSMTPKCAPGLYCQAECASIGAGRCYRICDTTSDCNATDAGTSTCSVSAVGAPFQLCTLPSCDPFNGGCPTGTSCYLLFPGTFCGCTGTKPVGATCTNVDDCSPGETCANPSNQSSNNQCTRICNAAHPTCDADGGATCHTVGSFGFCM
jgi:hypothetical protein